MAYTLSPSTLNIFSDCPRCFWLQFNRGIRRPDSIFPSLPSGVDRALKRYYDRYRKEGRVPPELSSIEGARLFPDRKHLVVWQNNFEGLSWTDAEGNRIHGAVDELLEEGDAVVVLDFKTRGFPLKEDSTDHYQQQMDIYTWLLAKNGHATKDYAYLLFYHPKEAEEGGSISFHTELKRITVSKEAAEKVIAEALAALKGPMPEASDGCGFCRYAGERRGE